MQEKYVRMLNMCCYLSNGDRLSICQLGLKSHDVALPVVETLRAFFPNPSDPVMNCDLGVMQFQLRIRRVAYYPHDFEWGQDVHSDHALFVWDTNDLGGFRGPMADAVAELDPWKRVVPTQNQA